MHKGKMRVFLFFLEMGRGERWAGAESAKLKGKRRRRWAGAVHRQEQEAGRAELGCGLGLEKGLIHFWDL
jgi:hypothetical protein